MKIGLIAFQKVKVRKIWEITILKTYKICCIDLIELILKKEHYKTCFYTLIKQVLMLLSGILAKVNKPNKYILISHKHKLIL